MLRLPLLLLLLLQLASSCYNMRKSNGGGQKKPTAGRTVNPADVALHPGYRIEPVAQGLTFPTSVTFDGSGRLHVIEAGYSYGEVWGEPRLLRVEGDGRTTVVATGLNNGPWTGLTWHEGAFYVSEGGTAGGGKILRITPDGKMTELIAGLPTTGDHHTNGIVVKDGYLYFGLGTATNSGVVGPDNYEYGWLKRMPSFHDIPCRDVVLSGQNYTSANPLTEAAGDEVTTGAFVPFGTPTTAGQIIKGQLPCSGAVLRMPLQGGGLELVAWGFRNPFGFGVHPDGRLFVTDNAYDDRGSRPVWGAGDLLWEVRTGGWYGWPDYSGNKALSGKEEFKVPKKPEVKQVLQSAPGTPPKPAGELGVHASANGLDFSRGAAFGFGGEAFIAEFGDMAPAVGKVLAPVGYKIVRVDPATGVVRDFAVNRGKRNGPASWLGSGGLERPVSVRFSPAGDALYLVDFGVITMDGEKAQPRAGTGMVWKISKR